MGPGGSDPSEDEQVRRGQSLGWHARADLRGDNAMVYMCVYDMLLNWMMPTEWNKAIARHEI